MGITHYIKKILPNSHSARFKEIKALPVEAQFQKAGELFYEECIKKASKFVVGELGRKDSPFIAVSKEKFFHEIMAITMWSLDKTFEGKKKSLMDRIRNMYGDYFKFSPALDGAALSGRYALYYESWNEITGHQDVFGQRAAENIFGNGTAFSVPQASFWIITYAHDSMKGFENLAKQCRRMKIRLAVHREKAAF